MHFLSILCATLIGLSAAGPCDIYGSAGTPCVAAHSVVRALYDNYGGPLYQVKRLSDNATMDISSLSPGGFANASALEVFCEGSSGLPPIRSIVNLSPVDLPGYSFRHCDAQGFISPSDGNLDHSFTVLEALNGAPGALSFQSVNFPTYYIAPVNTAEQGRLGIVDAPEADEASWLYTPVSGGGGFITSLGKVPGLSMTVGSNLTGDCASNYAPPSASVYLAPTGSATVWSIGTSSVCEIWQIYDQSPQANHLSIAPAGGAVPYPDHGVDAVILPINISGHKVYGAYFSGGMGYRRDQTLGIATGNEPETIYMVTSGSHYNDGCCFDYGNAEVNNHDDGAGTMECVYFGSWNATRDGWCGGSGTGPWVMADLEDGLWACNETGAINPTDPPMTAPYVVAMVKGGSDGWGLKGGDATQVGSLSTLWEGPRPPRYQPMQKQGAIILGIGGDNSDSAIGAFFEGVMTTGYSTDAADALVQANIAAAGYGK